MNSSMGSGKFKETLTRRGAFVKVRGYPLRGISSLSMMGHGSELSQWVPCRCRRSRRRAFI